MRNADSWGTAFIVFGTAAVMFALPAQPGRAVKDVAETIPANEVSYKITVSATKIPTECRSLNETSAGDVIARCQAIASGETQMTMVPVDAEVQVATKP